MSPANKTRCHTNCPYESKNKLTDGFEGGHEEGDEHREHRGAVEAELEGFGPEEGDILGEFNLGVDDELLADVADALLAHAGDEVAEEERDDDVAVLHHGGAEELDDDEHDEDGEAEADELGRAEGERDVTSLAASLAAADGAGDGGNPAVFDNIAAGPGVVLGDRGEADEVVSADVVLPGNFGAHGAAAPVLHAGAGEADADAHDGDAGDEGREHPPEQILGHEGEEDLEEGTDHDGTEHLAVCILGVRTVGFHGADAVLEHGEEGERGANHGEHAGAEHVGSSGNLKLQAVDDGEDAGQDQGRRDGVLLELNVGEGDAELHDHEGRGDETCGRGATSSGIVARNQRREAVLAPNTKGQKIGKFASRDRRDRAIRGCTRRYHVSRDPDHRFKQYRTRY